MRKSNRNGLNIFMVVVIAMMLPLSACDDDDNGTEPGNGNGETEKWEPYDFEDHGSATYEYDFQIEEEGEVQYAGSSSIEIDDPAVTVTSVMNGEESVYTAESSDNIEDNFSNAMQNSPFGAILYGGDWSTPFFEQELYVGASWSYSAGGVSLDAEITGMATFAGQEGYMVEYIGEDQNNGETQTYDICVNPDIPLPLMVEVAEEGFHFYLEMTNYQN